MSLEKELTVPVLSQTEEMIGFLHPRYVQIKEYNEMFTLRGIEITHALADERNQDLSRYDKMLVAGNKIWREEDCDGNSVLYVILGEKEYDFKNNMVTTYAEEVATELGQYKIIRNSAFSWTVNSAFVQNYLSELFEPGTIDANPDPVSYNGSLTPLAMLREIERQTGCEFEFKYEYDAVNKVIKRIIDFHEVAGKVIRTPVELGYNASEIKVKINESETRIAAGPIGVPENADTTWHQSRKAFEDLVVSGPIPLWVTKDDDGNDVNGPLANPPYPKLAGQNYVVTDDSSDLVASYQYIRESKASAAAAANYIYQDNFEDGILESRTPPYRDWTENLGDLEITSGLSGTYAIKHTGSGSVDNRNGGTFADYETSYNVSFIFNLDTIGVGTLAPYVTLFYPRYIDQNNNIRIETYYESGTQKIRLRIVEDGVSTVIQSANWMTGQMSTGINYYMHVKDTGSQIKFYIDGQPILSTNYDSYLDVSMKGVGANEDNIGIWDEFTITSYTAAIDQSFPRIYTVETNETNKYNLYWMMVDTIRSYAKPEITIECKIVDLLKLSGQGSFQYNCYDSIQIKLPGRDDLVEARIKKTTKDPRHPEEDQIEIGSYIIDFMSDFFRHYYNPAEIVNLDDETPPVA